MPRTLRVPRIHSSAWARESHDLAVVHCYLNGKIQGASAEAARADPHVQRPALPPGYLAAAEELAASRVILAGYRTADLLNSIFDPT
jgi:hypothetical protein